MVIARAMREKIAAEARYRCGYCLTDQRISGAQMHIEHIIPLAKGGSSEESNLWLSCAWCNSFKGTRTEGIDSQTGQQVSLFNPRRQSWFEHFTWNADGLRIVGLIPTGRATIDALRLNNKHIIPARRYWILAGWHPPDQ